MCAAVVSRGDPAPVFESGEHVLDFMTLFIKGPVILNVDFAVFLRRDAGCNSLCTQGYPEPVGIITPICEQLSGFGQGRE